MYFKYLVQIDKRGLPFRIFRGVHGVVQSLMLSNGQKRNLSSFRQRWWSVKNWFVQTRRTCHWLTYFWSNIFVIENLQNQISKGKAKVSKRTWNYILCNIQVVHTHVKIWKYLFALYWSQQTKNLSYTGDNKLGI